MAFVSLILFAAALGLFALYRRDARRAAAAEAWPRAPGVIESSSVTRHPPIDSESSESWSADVVYTYSVGGVPYQGRRIRFGPVVQHGREASAATAVERYPAGSAVSVAFDPDRPGEAVLETGKAGRFWLAFAAIIAAAGLTTLFL